MFKYKLWGAVAASFCIGVFAGLILPTLFLVVLEGLLILFITFCWLCSQGGMCYENNGCKISEDNNRYFEGGFKSKIVKWLQRNKFHFAATALFIHYILI